MIKITALIFEVKNATMKLSRLITCMFREYVKKLNVKSCTHSHPSCPLSMLQQLKSGSMAVFKNNFECPCNVHAAEQHSLLHPLQNISQSHTKDLTHLEIYLLGPPPPQKKSGWYFSVFSKSFFTRLSKLCGQLISTANTLIIIIIIIIIN